MALTAAQTQTVYEACGLRSEGGIYKLVFFIVWNMEEISDSSDDWDYGTVKSSIDARLALLTGDAETRLGTYITTYDDFATSSIKLRGEVIFDAAKELELARNRIRDIVGVEVTRVDRVAAARAQDNPRQGSVGR